MSTQTKPEQDKATSGPLHDLICVASHIVSPKHEQDAWAELYALKAVADEAIKMRKTQTCPMGLVETLATLAALRKEQS